MGKDTGLPKNIRQIGDIHGQEKIYLEDYVMTYIRKKEQQEQQGYLGIFLGERREEDKTVYVFIRGILEISSEQPQEQQEKEQQGKEKLSPKEQLGRSMAEHFPGWEVQGCCVIGKYPSKQLEQLTEWIPDAGKLIYHLQEQEETLYWKSQGEYRRIKGYFVFYEQNRRMQEYLAELFSDKTVEKESLPEQAVKSFREKIREKGEKKTGGILKLAGSFFAVTVLVIGAVVVNRIDQIRDVQNAAGDLVYFPQSADNGQSLSDSRQVSDSQGGSGGQEGSDGQGASGSQETPADAVWSAAEASAGADADTSGDEWMTGSDAFWEDVSAELSELSEQAQAGETAVQVNGQAQQEGEAAAQADSQKAQADAQAAQADSQTAQADAQAAQADSQTAQTDAQATQADAQAAQAGSQADSQAAQESSAAATQPESQSQEAEEPAQEAAVRSTQAAYVIKEGDTLAAICQKYYGNLNRMAEICEANSISDANMIMPGQKIVLP